MAIIRVPGGRKYDTVRRVFVDEPEPVEDTSYQGGWTPSVVASGMSGVDTVIRRVRIYNAWRSITSFISEIGDWFDDNSVAFSNNISFVFYIIAWISFGVGVIGLWIGAGFWAALIMAVIGGVIVRYVAGFAVAILMYILCGCFKVMRYIFYNVYTLLIAVIIIIAVIFFHQADAPQNRTVTNSSQVSNLPNYFCDVNTTLKVREHPRKYAKEIGQLKRHEEVYVYSIDNNFAKIDFKGRIAYASAEYLKPKGGPASISSSERPANRNKVTEIASTVSNSNMSATINRIWGEHNVFQGRQKGMKIHVKFNTRNMQNVQGKCTAYFYYKNGTALKDNNNAYSSSDGQVIVEYDFKPDYKESLYEDFVLFMPYNELHLPSEGKTDLKVHVVLQASPTATQPKKLTTSDWFYFWYGKLE
jgi:hypothetical protein